MHIDKSISVFFPAYNDETTIGKMVLDTLDILKKITNDYEVIVIDDCSPDRSGEIADELAKKYKQVRVIHHQVNKGYGGVLKTGFKEAKKDLIFYTDGDAQYDIKEIVKLISHIEDVDIVNGYKIKRGDNILRTILGRLYHNGAKILFNLKIRDVDCDFRLMKREIFDKVDLKLDSGSICIELVKKIQNAGYKFAEVPVHHYKRVGGISQFFRLRRILKTFRDFTILWYQLMVMDKIRSWKKVSKRKMS